MLSGSPKSVVLYHAPPSFYSQIARLVLAEKGAVHETRVALAGPPSFETYQPWYMRLNSGGTVPTLVIDEEPIDDSRDILDEVDRRFDGPALTPNDPQHQADMKLWIERSYQLPERILAYGSQKLRKLGARVNTGRRRSLLAHQKKYPNLSQSYAKKIADIEAFSRQATDPKTVREAKERCEQTLDELDAWLLKREYVCGDSYSLAEVVWTVTIARQFMLGESPLTNRPALTAWYCRMKVRSSFSEADVWESFHPSRLLPIILQKFPLQVLVIMSLFVLLVLWAFRSLN